MNLVVKDVDNLDEMPSFEKFHDYSRDRHRGDGVNYSRLKRWLESHTNVNVDVVFAKFVELSWIPVEYRTYKFFRYFVEVNTTMIKGEVYYYRGYSNDAPVPIKGNIWGKIIYVHPESNTIQVYKGTRIDYKAQRQAERDAKLRILGDYHQLNKVDGIWYEVKGVLLEDVIQDNTHRNTVGLNYVKALPTDDLLTPRMSFWDRMYSTSPTVKVILKRQISGKELKKYGLKND